MPSTIPVPGPLHEPGPHEPAPDEAWTRVRGSPVKLPPFTYAAPASLDEVLDVLGEHGDEAKLLAGGQSLVPMLAMRLARPVHLVDLNRIDALLGIEDRGDVLALGALTRERDAERSPVVADRVPALAAALPLVGHVAIRTRGTIGGSLVHADAAAELPAVAVLTGATMVVRRRDGERTVAAEDFFVGHYTSAIADDECLVEVRLPSTPPGAGWSCQEVVRRHGDFALAGATAMVALDAAGDVAEARVCCFGVADRPVRAAAAEAAMAGSAPGPETFAAAAAAATDGLEPVSDVHASGATRRHLAGVAVRRALAEATARAGGPR